MREIKFRSWNKEHECFFYFHNGCYYNTIDLSHKISERICFEFRWDNAEQYTGLKSKSGVEIYEGDILKYIDGSIGHVYYSTTGGMVCFVIDFTNSIPGRYWEIVEVYLQKKAFEIIGNIHEGIKNA